MTNDRPRSARASPCVEPASAASRGRVESTRKGWFDLRDLNWRTHAIGQSGAVIAVGAVDFLASTALGGLDGSWWTALAAIGSGAIGVLAMAFGVRRLRSA